MPDFTSALYLGLRHAARSLRPWAQLTSGIPAALGSPPEARVLAHKLATLVGCDTATLAPSTLHLFLDLPALLGRRPATVYVESGSYAVGRWGVELVKARGVAVRTFAHHEPAALERSLATCRTPPLVVIDGLCPACGGPGPLAAYAQLVQSRGGRLLIDDTQALGVLGRHPTPRAPYGHGGGGSLRYHAVRGPHVLLVASLAKAFGVPLAILAGSHLEVSRYEARSDTRVHCSPASTAALRAAEQALALNRARGDALRARLARNVSLFRAGAAGLGIPSAGGPFPVQGLPPLPARELGVVHEELRARGVFAVPQRLPAGQGRLCFLINARHTRADIDATMLELNELAPLLMARHERVRSAA